MAKQVLLLAIILGISGCASVSATNQIKVLHASQSQISLQIGERTPEPWQPDPKLDPAIIDAPVAEGSTENICLRVAEGKACFELGLGDYADLVIERGGDRQNVRINTIKHIPAARFSSQYQAANKGRFQVMVPDVYEMVNIAIALTDYAKANPGLVATNGDYHARMLAHFEQHRNHPFVQAMSKRMEEDVFWYFRFKMNGYAFDFDPSGRIVRSPIYNRTGFNGDPDNDLLPLLDLMQSFAKDTSFLSFYQSNLEFYKQQISYFENEADVMLMWAWLGQRFPEVRAYDGVKVVFSPLVGPNQSITWIEEDGYRELQPHINFPYSLKPELSPRGAAIARSEILFTEVNHGFINPTADNYLNEIETALGDRTIWADDTKAVSNYPNDLSLFLEYMNWGLISLYEHDVMDEPDRVASRARIERNMVERRGFKNFAKFNAFLIDLYSNRRRGETVASLYPKIIAWFREESAVSAK